MTLKGKVRKFIDGSLQNFVAGPICPKCKKTPMSVWTLKYVECPNCGTRQPRKK